MRAWARGGGGRVRFRPGPHGLEDEPRAVRRVERSAIRDAAAARRDDDHVARARNRPRRVAARARVVGRKDVHGRPRHARLSLADLAERRHQRLVRAVRGVYLLFVGPGLERVQPPHLRRAAERFNREMRVRTLQLEANARGVLFDLAVRRLAAGLHAVAVDLEDRRRPVLRRAAGGLDREQNNREDHPLCLLTFTAQVQILGPRQRMSRAAGAFREARGARRSAARSRRRPRRRCRAV